MIYCTELKICDRQISLLFKEISFRWNENSGGGIKQLGQVLLVLYILEEIFDGIPRPQRKV